MSHTPSGPVPWFRRYEWDAIAGIVAAGAALILHLLHIVEPDVLLTITLVLLALLLLRQLRHEGREERVESTTTRVEHAIVKLQNTLTAPRSRWSVPVSCGPRVNSSLVRLAVG